MTLPAYRRAPASRTSGRACRGPRRPCGARRGKRAETRSHRAQVFGTQWTASPARFRKRRAATPSASRTPPASTAMEWRLLVTHVTPNPTSRGGRRMAVREFKDKSGTTWRAWDITPEAILPQTKAEEYLADCFRQGWIVFENLSTGEKRRLSPYPLDWEHLHDTQLEALLWLNAAPVLSNRRAAAAAAPAEPPCDED